VVEVISEFELLCSVVTLVLVHSLVLLILMIPIVSLSLSLVFETDALAQVMDTCIHVCFV